MVFVIIKEDVERIVADVRQLGTHKVYVVLVGVIVALSIVVVALASSFGATHSALVARWFASDANRCATPGCMRASGWIATNMDVGVDPCDDFFRFACGGWNRANSIPPDEHEVTLVGHLDNDVDEKLRELIENKIRRGGGTSTTTPADQKLRDFFRLCIHDYGRMKDAGGAVVGLIRQALGNWYVLDPASWKGSWNLQQSLVNTHGGLQVNVFFASYFSADRPRANNILTMYWADFGMNQYKFNSDKPTPIQEAYKNYMREVATLLVRDANMTLEPSEQRNRIEQFVSDAFGQEEQLAKLLRNVASSGGMYRRIRTTVGTLNDNFTQFNWQSVLSGVFENVPLTSDTPVLLYASSYFSLVNELLLNESQSGEGDRMLNNYIAWRIASKYVVDLSWEYQQAAFKFREIAYGIREIPGTWKMCLRKVKERLGSLLASMFVRAHMTDDVRAQVTEMFENIRSTMTRRVLELDWMDAVTQNRSIEKLNAVKVQVGFSEAYYNTTLMEQMHETLQIDASQTYFQNLLNLNLFQRRLRVKLFLGDQESHYDHLPILGSIFHYWTYPYYSMSTSTLMIPAGATLEPVFSSGRTNIMNYALLGSAIAGQLVNAIGPSGRYFWFNGTFMDWWTNGTSNEYKKKKECFDGYFDGLTAGPYYINGTNKTVPVNGRVQTFRYVDDMAGARNAFTAYGTWLKNNVDKTPVGLDMSPAQLYFISLAQTKCYLRTDARGYRLATMNYLPEDLELNAIVSHMSEFSSAFQCPVGSRMRTTYQCKIF